MSTRIGIDVGGTFTDSVAVDEETGAVTTHKAFTNYRDLAEPVLTAATQFSRRSSQDDQNGASPVSSIFHATTLASNALVERNTPAVGLLCTEGFRDILDTRRTRKKYLYDVLWDKPENLIRRMLRREVTERLNYRGETLIPLDEESARSAVGFLARNGIRDFAVCLLYSFLDPAHERRLREIILEMVPDAEVSISSDIMPEQREFERTTTTVLNAMIRRLIDRYLLRLESGIDQEHLSVPLQIMKANGGVARPTTVRERPIETYESGPAAGVTAAVAVGHAIGNTNLITFDVGGTTSDVSLIWDGNPIMSLEEELEWSIPIRIPMIHIRSVGSGGGSIAWIDKGGALRVGPRSAGSDPGPACYGRGGTAPTLTDANLLLGRMSPDLLGGEVTLDRSSAESAIESAVATALNWDIVRAASGISTIASMDMVHLIREVTVNRGYDPRDCALMCFGGAGGMHAVDVARELEMSEVIVPANPGVFSAIGCLYADVRHEYVRTYVAPTSPAPIRQLNDVFESMRATAREALRKDDLGAASVIFEHSLHLRYHGEAYAISIPVDYSVFGGDSQYTDEGEAYELEVAVSVDESDKVTQEAIVDAVEHFHSKHERVYGFAREDPVENVNVGLKVTVRLPKPAMVTDLETRKTEDALASTRAVFFVDRFFDTPVYNRYALGSDAVVAGPAILEESHATIVVPPGSVAKVDEFRNVRIMLTRKGKP